MFIQLLVLISLFFLSFAPTFFTSFTLNRIAVNMLYLYSTYSGLVFSICGTTDQVSLTHLRPFNWLTYRNISRQKRKKCWFMFVLWTIRVCQIFLHLADWSQVKLTIATNLGYEITCKVVIEFLLCFDQISSHFKTSHCLSDQEGLNNNLLRDPRKIIYESSINSSYKYILVP